MDNNMKNNNKAVNNFYLFETAIISKRVAIATFQEFYNFDNINDDVLFKVNVYEPNNDILRYKLRKMYKPKLETYILFNIKPLINTDNMTQFTQNEIKFFKYSPNTEIEKKIDFIKWFETDEPEIITH